MPLVSFRPKGMNNVDPRETVGRPDPESRSLVYTEGISLVNVDPNEQSGGPRRRGITLEIPGMAPHSGWSDGRQAYFVEGGALKSFTPDGSNILALLSSNEPMAFCSVNDIVVASNGVDFLIIEDGDVATAFEPADPHKVSMSPGTCLEFYNGRLYAALGRVLYASDSLDTAGGVEQMDERRNVVAVFASDIVMVKRATGGLFVSDGTETFFFAGEDPFIGEGFAQRSVFPYPAIAGTVQAIAPSLLGSADIQGEACMWASERGVCLGLPGGSVANISSGTFANPIGRSGTAIVRENNGQVHFLCVVRDQRPAYNANQGRDIPVTDQPISD